MITIILIFSAGATALVGLAGGTIIMTAALLQPILLAIVFPPLLGFFAEQGFDWAGFGIVSVLMLAAVLFLRLTPEFGRDDPQ